MENLVCDRCGATRGNCIHAVEPGYCLETRQAYTKARTVALYLMGIITLFYAVVLCLILWPKFV